MYIEEILPPGYTPGADQPVHEVARAREIEDRNQQNLLAWHQRAFGATCGEIIHNMRENRA